MDVEVNEDIDLLFWLFKRGFKASSCSGEWYRSSSGTDVEKAKAGTLPFVSQLSDFGS